VVSFLKRQDQMGNALEKLKERALFFEGVSR